MNQNKSSFEAEAANRSPMHGFENEDKR